MRHMANRKLLRTYVKDAENRSQPTPKSVKNKRRYFKKQNVGTLDRIFRAMLGTAMIGSVFYLNHDLLMNFEYWVLLPLIGSYPALTAILGWDPVLDVSNKSSETELKGDTCGTVREQVENVIHSVS